jgi:hypothetical protein
MAVCRALFMNFVMDGAAAHCGRSRARIGRKKLVQAEHPQATARGLHGGAPDPAEHLIRPRRRDRSRLPFPADGTTATPRSYESRIRAGNAEPGGHERADRLQALP